MRIPRFIDGLEPSFAGLAATPVVTALVVALSVGGAWADATSTALFSTSGGNVFGQTVDLSATVYGNGPTGTITFKDGSKTLGTATPDLLGVGATISGGLYHTCAVTGTGAARCWGANAQGQLGDGTTTDSLTPVAVTGLFSDVVAIAAGAYHACALTGAGAVMCWGGNLWGQLGDGTTATRTDPVFVIGLTSGVVAIAAGRYFTCALTGTGDVRCWGRNTLGQLGNGTTNDSKTPVTVGGLSSRVTRIAAAGSHTCALDDAGAVYCWGENTEGQIGNGTTTNSATPVPVNGLSSGVAAIGVGRFHSCAITNAAALRCWGRNDYGQLGNGTTTNSTVPVSVTGLSSGVVSVAGGSYHTCALAEPGAVSCWGRNNYGQLGDGSTTDRTAPVAVMFPPHGGIVATGWYHSCVVTGTGTAGCWGRNTHGQIGDGTTTDRTTPFGISGLIGPDSVLLPARAEFSTAALSAGNHALTASYGGDSDNDASVSQPFPLTINKGKTRFNVRSIKVRPNRPKAGKVARVTVRVKAKAPASGKPTGKIVVRDGKKKIGKFRVTKGKASFKTSFAKRGKHKIKANYRGSRNWVRSSGSRNVRVRR